ncbi:MAG: rhomboid family intramembrane serine protease [Pikeienuella sp.]
MSLIDPGVTHRPVHPLLWALAGIMVAVELLFAAVDAGVLGPLLGRTHIYDVFGFWDLDFEHAISGNGWPLALSWSPVTYAFLHGGWLHLLMNAAPFLGLGHMITVHAGIGALLQVFLATAIGGALAFALLADFNGAMVGASGVVFGFIGLVTAWQEQMLRRRGEDRSPIWQRILGLIALNAVLDIALAGALAWEAHLGGFVAGWLMASAIRPRRSRPTWAPPQVPRR